MKLNSNGYEKFLIWNKSHSLQKLYTKELS